MSEGVTVRAATREDLGPLGEMAAALVRFHHAIDERRFFMAAGVEQGYRRWFGKELENPDAVLLAGVGADGAVLGYAYGRVEERDWNQLLGRHAALHDILVKPEARGTGLGRALLDAFCAEVKGRGAPRVVLHTAYTNAVAQSLFKARGFRPTMIEMTLELED